MTVAIPVRIFLDGGQSIPGDIEDISLGGAFIRCSQAVPIGQKVRIEIHFSGTQVLEGKVTTSQTREWAPPKDPSEEAVVRWSEAENAFGVEFTSVNLATRQFVTKLMDYLQSTSRVG